jgi:hypothetical protein
MVLPALSYTLIYLYGATSEFLTYLLHLFASHYFRSFQVSLLLTYIHAPLGHVRRLAYYRFTLVWLVH